MDRFDAWMREAVYCVLTGALIVSVPVGVGLGLYCYHVGHYTDVSAAIIGGIVPSIVLGSWLNCDYRWIEGKK